MTKWLQKYVNIPYSEVDCWGLCCKVYKEQWGLELGAGEAQNFVQHGGVWVKAEAPYKLGDLLLFRDSELSRHVGLAIDGQFMLHTNEHLGSCIERWNRHLWEKRLIKTYRHYMEPQ